MVNPVAGKKLAIMPAIYRAEWGLDSEGEFRRDPWFLVKDGKVLQSGFGAPPGGYIQKKSVEGVITPGFVNSHTHLQFSYIQYKKENKFNDVHEFAKFVMKAQAPAFDEQVMAARKAMNRAALQGTFFYIDISNSPGFLSELAAGNAFQGIQFLELLGFSSPHDNNRIVMSESALAENPGLHLAVHSVYGSSPRIFAHVGHHEKEIVSIHLFEEPGEEDLFLEHGKTVDFLREIHQYTRHDEIYGGELISYLQKYLSAVHRLLFVHLTHADNSLLVRLEKSFPASAVVLCHRSNEYLGYRRSHWQGLTEMKLPLLLGTDSCASAPDLSILNEIQAILSLDVIPQNMVWKAATFNAYRYFNIRDVPCFIFKGALPQVNSLAGAAAEFLFTITL